MRHKFYKNLNNNSLCFIKYNEFKKLKNRKINKYLLAELLSQMCRINTLSMIKLAGSGHIGTRLNGMG